MAEIAGARAGASPSPSASVRPMQQGRIVATVNLKGGTGKSTLAVNLACLAARERAPVLLVDADPQGTAFAWLDPASLPEGVTVQASPVTEDATAWADAIFDGAGRYGRIVIDMPPQFGPGMSAALRLVDALVIPVTPSAIDLRATAKTLQQIKAVQKTRNGRPVCLLVPNRVDQRTAIGRAIQQALRDLDLEVAPPIAQRASHAMAFAARSWIGAHAPGSPALREVAAVAAKLETLLEAADANDYVVSQALCCAADALTAAALIDTTERNDEPVFDGAPEVACPATIRRRAVDEAPLPRSVRLDATIRSAQAPRVDPESERRLGWFAGLVAGLRFFGRPHTG